MQSVPKLACQCCTRRTVPVFPCMHARMGITQATNRSSRHLYLHYYRISHVPVVQILLILYSVFRVTGEHCTACHHWPLSFFPCIVDAKRQKPPTSVCFCHRRFYSERLRAPLAAPSVAFPCPCSLSDACVRYTHNEAERAAAGSLERGCWAAKPSCCWGGSLGALHLHLLSVCVQASGLSCTPLRSRFSS